MKITRKEFGGVTAFLREGTPDETVASHCLGTEFRTVCEMLADVTRPNTVLDLGGYIGAAAIKFATSIPRCTVLSVEPSAENFRMLRLNTMRYRNIVPINLAVGRDRGRMHVFSRDTGEWGHTLVAEPKDCAKPTRVGTVDVVTVADILERYSPKGNLLSLAKVDIEGGEAEVFERGGWSDGFAVVLAELHDRITDGCTTAWRNAVQGGKRYDLEEDGEKVISFDVDVLARLHEPIGLLPVSLSSRVRDGLGLGVGGANDRR